MKNTYSSEQKEYKDHYYKRFIEAHNTNVLAFQALLDDPLKSNVSKVNHDPKWNHYLDCDHVLRDLVRFMETIQQQAFDLWREIREHFVQGFLYSPKTNNQMMYPFPSNELVFPIFPSCIKEKKVDDNRDGSWIVDASDTIFDADIENFKRLLHRALKYSTNYIAHCHLSSDDQISLKFLLKEKKVVITCQRFELVHESSIPFPTKMVALLKEKAKLNLNLNLKLNEVNLISFIFEKSKNAKQVHTITLFQFRLLYGYFPLISIENFNQDSTNTNSVSNRNKKTYRLRKAITY